MLNRLPAYFLLLGLACQFGHAQRSGASFSILSESIGSLVADGNTSTTGFSQIGATEAIQGTFSSATTGFTGTIGFLSQQNSRPLSVVFDSIGDMGRNQVFQVKAIILDGITNQATQIQPVYSIVSGPATISGSQITCGNSTGVVTVRAVASGSNFFTSSATSTFNITNKPGQTIDFKLQETGGLRDLILSPKPTPIGRMATTTSNLTVSFSLTANPGNVFQLVGSGANANLVFNKNFSGSIPDAGLTVQITATQSGNGSYNAAASVVREITIKKPSKSAFYDERRFDPRYEIEKTKFARKLSAKKNLVGLIDLNGDGSVNALDAELMFDSDDFDSDGDGVNNFLERALGGDSLSNDGLEILPQAINMGDGKQRLSFRQYQAQYNDEGIEYIVERSIDGMTWTTSGITQVDLNGAGSPGKGITIAGGMERVLFETTQTTAQAGGSQFIRVRIRSKESNSLVNALPGEGEISGTMATEGIAQLSSGTLGKPIYAGQVTNGTSTTVSFEPTFNSSEVAIDPFTSGVFNSSVKTPALSASLSGSGVGSIGITYAGSGFSTAPKIIIEYPTSGDDQATATASINGAGEISSISITNAGSGYTVPPKVKVLGGPHLVRLSEKGDSNEGRVFLITDNNATRLTLDISRLANGETLQNILQTEYSVDIVPANTLGSILGRTLSDLDLTPANANASGGAGADFIYLYFGSYYSFCFMPAGSGRAAGWYSTNYLGWGLQNDVVIYPDESMIIAKRNSGSSTFTSKVYLGNPVQFELPDSFSFLNSSSKVLGQLVPHHSIGNGSNDFRTGISDTDNNADKISMLDGTSWSDFYYQSGVNDGITNGARATARAGTASGNGLSDADVSIASGTITSLQSSTASGAAVDHNQSEYTLITLSGNAPMSGFIISLNGIYGKKINENGTMELDRNGTEVSTGGGITVKSGLTGSFEIIARPNSSKIVIAQKRDVNLDSSKGAKSWSTGQGGSGYNMNGKAYFLGGGHSTMAVATATVSGGMVVGFDFSGTGNSRGAGYTSSPKVFISGGGWRKTGLPNIPQDGEVVLPSFVTRNYPSGQSSYFLPENQFQGELLSGMRAGQNPTSIDMFFSGLGNLSPTDLNSTIPLSIAENQSVGTVVGEFNATDPNANATLTYYLVSGVGDGNNSLFTLDTNGTLKTATTFDFESNSSTYSIRVQARDEYNASVEGNFTVALNNIVEDFDGDTIEDYYDLDDDGDGFSDLDELAYGSDPRNAGSLANTGPGDLNSTTPLSIAENQPVGTIVGELNAIDPDANSTLTYILVSGPGDMSNDLFTLDSNGTLKSAITFDYETNALFLSIRVQVRDEFNATMEGVFTVLLTNIIEDLDDDTIEDHYDLDDDGDGFSDEDEIAYGSNPRDSSSLANAPPVLEGNQSLSIAENEAIGTFIGNITAYDPDNNQSIPIVLEFPSSAFVLDLNQSIRSSEVFDYESNQTSYSLSFLAKDEFNATGQLVINIDVTNVVEDRDNDGFEDAYDLDIDGDGIENSKEIYAGTNPLNPDTDEDGLLDGEEMNLGSNPLSTDTDEDGLSDKTEYEIGTNPLNQDTDGDGFKDKEEVLAFTSPEDANDYPGNASLKSPNEGPDGKFYELVTGGYSLEEAKELAKSKGADLPYLTHHKSELNKFLIQLLIRSEIGSAWALGSNDFLPWYIKRYNPMMLFTSNRGFSYSYSVGNLTKLPVLLVREKPALQLPVVLTLQPEMNGEQVLAKAQILDTGGGHPFRVGFWVSEKITVRDSDNTARMISGIQDQNLFIADIERLSPGKTYYIRAFAENSAGLKYGSVRRVKIEIAYIAPFGANALVDNWYKSDWFGTFKHVRDEWIFHQELGWIYQGPLGQNGIWFWSNSMEWCWTRSDLWPYLWFNKHGNWMYYFGVNQERPTFWNYSTKSYFQW